MTGYLHKQPAPEERIEIVLAHLCAMYANVHSKPGAQPARVVDFLPYLDPFTKKATVDMGRYSETDRSILQALGAVSK